MNLPQIESNANVTLLSEALSGGPVKACFLQITRTLFSTSSTNPDGFLAYFTGKAPLDEEISGLLSIATSFAASY
ncbi:MAG: hypothetical protein ACRD2O_08650 [Terriglobia bacterium]